MSDKPGPNIALLKWIVIVLGILIVVFASVIGVKMYQLMTAGPDVEESKVTMPAISMPKTAASFKDMNIKIPAGAEVLQMVAGPDRLYLHIGNGGEATEVYVVDVSGGTLLGRIKLTPEASE